MTFKVIKTVWRWSPSALFMRRMWGLVTVISIIIYPFAWYFGWLSSVIFVSHISMVALILGGASAWQSGRVEVRQEEEVSVSNGPV